MSVSLDGGTGEGLTAAAFDAEWTRITRKSPILSSHIKAEIVQRVAQTAAARSEEPKEFAARLISAFVEMLEAWRTAGAHHGAPTLSDFSEERRFNAAVDWLDGKRPKAAPPRKGSTFRGAHEPDDFTGIPSGTDQLTTFKG